MAYQRKTETLWVIQGSYGNGWEDVYITDALTDARGRLRDYRENEHIPFRVFLKRFSLTESKGLTSKRATERNFI